MRLDFENKTKQFHKNILYLVVLLRLLVNYESILNVKCIQIHQSFHGYHGHYLHPLHTILLRIILDVQLMKIPTMLEGAFALVKLYFLPCVLLLLPHPKYAINVYIKTPVLKV